MQYTNNWSYKSDFIQPHRIHLHVLIQGVVNLPAVDKL